MVIYGILTETSIADLFIAGIIPGLVLIALFMLTVWLLASLFPELGPKGPGSTIREKVAAVRQVWGTILLFVIVLGGIYTGIFTPTEAAGIGALGALGLGATAGRMNRSSFFQALLDYQIHLPMRGQHFPELLQIEDQEHPIRHSKALRSREVYFQVFLIET